LFCSHGCNVLEIYFPFHPFRKGSWLLGIMVTQMLLIKNKCVAKAG
jgi:hypothetical protein